MLLANRNQAAAKWAKAETRVAACSLPDNQSNTPYGAKNASEGRNVSRRFSKIRVKDASKPIMTMHIAS
jgi:hypothetical protein